MKCLLKAWKPSTSLTDTSEEKCHRNDLVTPVMEPLNSRKNAQGTNLHCPMIIRLNQFIRRGHWFFLQIKKLEHLAANYPGAHTP